MTRLVLISPKNPVIDLPISQEFPDHPYNWEYPESPGLHGSSRRSSASAMSFGPQAVTPVTPVGEEEFDSAEEPMDEDVRVRRTVRKVVKGVVQDAEVRQQVRKNVDGVVIDGVVRGEVRKTVQGLVREPLRQAAQAERAERAERVAAAHHHGKKERKIEAERDAAQETEARGISFKVVFLPSSRIIRRRPHNLCKDTFCTRHLRALNIRGMSNQFARDLVIDSLIDAETQKKQDEKREQKKEEDLFAAAKQFSRDFSKDVVIDGLISSYARQAEKSRAVPYSELVEEELGEEAVPYSELVEAEPEPLDPLTYGAPRNINVPFTRLYVINSSREGWDDGVLLVAPMKETGGNKKREGGMGLAAWAINS